MYKTATRRRAWLQRLLSVTASLSSVASLSLVATACGSESGSIPDTLVLVPITVDATDWSTQKDSVEPESEVLEGQEVSSADSDVEEAPNCPGGFGCPCAENDACNSGFCVPTDTGDICTVPCTDYCPNGFECKGINSGGPDVAFVCVAKPDLLCVPCSVDADCPGTLETSDDDGAANALCIEDGLGGGRCGRGCQLDEDCPQGFECDPAQGLDGTDAGMQCIPSAGRCPCRQKLLGVSWPCLGQNELGACGGQTVCAAVSDGYAWSACDAPGAKEDLCNGADDDCDGMIDEGSADADGDGLQDCVDPDSDGDEIPNESDNCETESNPDQLDGDKDGTGDACDSDDDNDFSPDDLDCQPNDPLVYPGAPEPCNGVDDNCDGELDDGLIDLDEDQVPDCTDTDDDADGILDVTDNCTLNANPDQLNTDLDGLGDACDPDDDGDFDPDATDCEPVDPKIGSSAIEVCNGVDDDCDAQTDEGSADTDDDGIADCEDDDDDGDGVADVIDVCPLIVDPDQSDIDFDDAGDSCDKDDDNDLAPDGLDCAPFDPKIYPGAPEPCDGKDNDCSGVVDDGAFDTDGDGTADCEDADDDGDGVPDSSDDCPLTADPEQLDTDSDGVGDACDKDDDADFVQDALDCAPLDPSVKPGALELCDGIDQNCDEVIDDGFPDTDVDGLPDCRDEDDDQDVVLDVVDNCVLVQNGDQLDTDFDDLGDACDKDDDNDLSIDLADCDPVNPFVNPGATESCNGVDDDCKNGVDDGFTDTDGDSVANCLDPDDDNDGVVDLADVCPVDVDPKQTNSDSDALGDACDLDDDGDESPDLLDCAPLDASVSPLRLESCDGLDQDCDELLDEGFADLDQDGIPDCIDRDDDGDQVDDAVDNCPSASNDDQADLDFDTLGDVCDLDDDGDLSADLADCEPRNPAVHPGAFDVCNGIDDDCSGDADEGAVDTDLDGAPDCTDLDDDADGVADAADNCALVPNDAQQDFDSDGSGDLCDPDDDADLSLDSADCAPFDPNIHPGAAEPCDGIDNDCNGVIDPGSADTDGDGLGDCVDSDDDNDGIVDPDDDCPLVFDPQQVDLDGDSLGDLCDNDVDGDGIGNGSDNCTKTPNPSQANLDGDLFGDACDSDRDGDGAINISDNCPDRSNSNQADIDQDGQGDLCDTDVDGDGVVDGSDCAPLNAAIYPGAFDACNGLDDNCNGGVDEGFPNLDGDTLADCVDGDDDGDLVGDVSDNCPLVSNPLQENLDADASGDACDPDDDSDGALDPSDNCPRIANPNQADLDGDDVGDACDPDDDGDGVQDGVDNCPTLANATQKNFDGDGLGDDCDSDDDADGDFDVDDCAPYDATRSKFAAELCNQSDDDCDGASDEGSVCPTGCSDGGREGFIDVLAHPRVAACAGGFTIPGVVASSTYAPACGRGSGDDSSNPSGSGCNVADLCATGWHVCTSSADFAANSPSGCAPIGNSGSQFFASRQSSPGNAICGGGSNDLFGCGTLGAAPDTNCSPFDRFSNNLCGSLTSDWSCGGDGYSEADNVTKLAGSGGALCCKD